MPYRIVKRKGSKPYKIINKQTGKIVGSSDARDKAERSIGYREAAEKEKQSRG